MISGVVVVILGVVVVASGVVEATGVVVVSGASVVLLGNAVVEGATVVELLSGSVPDGNINASTMAVLLRCTYITCTQHELLVIRNMQ